MTVQSTVQYEVVHWINGRIRLRIPRLVHDRAFGQRLCDEVASLPRIRQVRVNPSSASLVVTYQPEPTRAGRNGEVRHADRSILPQLLECLRRAAGGDPVPATARTQTAAVGAGVKTAAADGSINYVDRLGLPVLGIALSAGALAGLALPGVLVGGIILAAAIPIFKRTAQGIRDEHRLTVDFLDASAIVLLTAQASFLAPAVVVGIIEGSEILRDWTARRNKQVTIDLLLGQDHHVLVERNGQQAQLTWDEIEIGDVLVLYPGDQIPVDGCVVEGYAAVDEHQMTGDFSPVTRREGDDVRAATWVVEGYLRIVATRTGHDTRAAAMLALADSAPNVDTRVSNYARKVGNGAVVPTLAVAAAVWGASGSVARATGIVSLDLGTGMRVSVPVAILSAQTQAARQGILFRSGRALEMLAQVDTILFDKTATLTEGRLSVTNTRAVQAHMPPATVLQLAASAEQGLDHPVARAIVCHAAAQGIVARPCTTWNYVAGEGVVAEIDGKTVHVGNRALMVEAGIDGAVVRDATTTSESELATVIYVACAGELLGVIQCADTLRAESVGVLASLRAMNKTPLLVSGDHSGAAHGAAASLDIQAHQVYAELLPHQKAELVQTLRASGRKVAVVGDGINDVAAMAHADVAIALGSGTDLARATADIVLLNDDLRDLVAATEIARHTLQIVEQNKWIVVAPNVAAMVYGVVTVLNPIAGVVINNGTALVAGLNSLRALRGPRKQALLH